MNHRPESSQPRRAGRGIARTRLALTTLGGLAVFLTPAIGLAPAASATVPPGFAPVFRSPTSATAPAHFPLWAVVAMVAATVVLSVATTLITLAAEHMRRARRTPAATADPQSAAPSLSVTSEPEAGQARCSHLRHGRARPPGADRPEGRR